MTQKYFPVSNECFDLISVHIFEGVKIIIYVGYNTWSSFEIILGSICMEFMLQMRICRSNK